MILGLLTLITALAISAIAIYYSIAGLVAIFSAAAIPIMIMGASLEIGKLVTAVWLHKYWSQAKWWLRSYLAVAVILLMFITSLGIFGFLSKAHSDQGLVSGDVQAKIAVYDEKIKISKDNIEANRKALKQMDEAVDQSMARSTTEQGASRAVSIRQSQARERTRLQNEIAAEQKTITKISEERAPIAAEVRKVEAEVGPIKYIAAFVYGDNPDTNLLEKAVTWVIITIIIVFDPLAVLLLIASQYTFEFNRKRKDEEELLHKTVPLWVPPPEEKKPDYEPDDGSLSKNQLEQVQQHAQMYQPEKPNVDNTLNETVNAVKHEPMGEVLPETIIPPTVETDVRVEQVETQVDGFVQNIEAQKKTLLKSPEELSREAEYNLKEQDSAFQESKTAWKDAHPNQTLKHYKNLYVKGLISSLPWEQTAKEDNYNISEGYQQNAEQSENTLFNKLSKK